METHLLSSPTVILGSDAKSEENLGWVVSPVYTAGPPGQPIPRPTQTSPYTQDWYTELPRVCSSPSAIFADGQGQSQEPMQLSLNQ